MSLPIPQELIEQLKKGNVVLFCGAGISASEGGLPSGEQLAQELAKRAGVPELVNASLPKVAQAYELKMGHYSLIEYITGRIDDPRYIPLRTHRLIASLPFSKIITTNWDNLLEGALREANKTLIKVVRDSNLPFAGDEKKVLLIKLRSSIEQPDTIIITGDDYYDVFAHRPMIANFVRAYFTNKTILFLGFDLADEDFKRLYYEVVRPIEVQRPRAYAVQLNPDGLTIEYWKPEPKNVQIIDADATAFLEVLAEKFEQGVIPITPSKPTPGVVHQPRRIDAALPSQAQVGKPIDLVVAAKLSESPSLAPAEIRAAGVSRKFPNDAQKESKPVEIVFPVNERTGRATSATLEIQVIAPSFEVHGSNRKSLLVPPDRDSELCTFPLSPRIPGELEVGIELYSQGVLVGTMRLDTMVRPDSVPIDRWPALSWKTVALPLVLVIVASSGDMTIAVSQLPSGGPPGKYQIEIHDVQKAAIGDEASVTQLVSVQRVQTTQNSSRTKLRQGLVDCLSEEELRTLCFDMGLDYESLPAQGKAGKAREIVAHFERINSVSSLVEQCRRLRPNGPWDEIHERSPQLIVTPQVEAKRQEHLGQLYAEAKQAEVQRDWPRAIDLFQRILEIDRGYKDVSERLLEAKEQEHLGQLYAEARQAEANQDRPRAIDLLRQVLAIDGNYKDVSQKLTEAKKQWQLQSLYAEADRAYARKDWARAIELFQQVLAIDGNYKDAPQKLAEAERQWRLQLLLTEAEQAYARKDWTRAIELLQQVLAIDGKYKDASQRLSQAIRQRRFEQLRARIRQAVPPIIAIMALTVIVMGTWRYRADIRALLPQPMPAATPTSAWTPTPTTARLSTLTPTPIATGTPALTFTPILTPIPSPPVGITVTLRGQSLPIECGGKVLLPSSGIILIMADIPITSEQERELHWSALAGKMNAQEGRTSAYSQDPNALKPDVVSLERQGIRICYFYVVVQ